MQVDNYWTRRIGRRRLVRGAALGGVGLAGAALLGCGTDDDGDGGDADTASASGNGGAGTAAPSGTTEPSAAKRGGTLRFHIAAEPPNFDLHANSTYAIQNAIAPAFNALVQFDPADPNESPDSVIPDMAESWEVSDDGTQYTFSLVQNGKFHNGQPFTSADVKATFERIKDPPEGVVSPRRDQFTSVANIETPDDHTVVFNLSRPTASLLPIVATAWNGIYSAEDIGNDVDFETQVNGTGPFRLEEYLRGNRLALVRNEEYHSDTYPYMDAITIFIVPDNSTAMASFQSGELDMHRDPAPAEVESLVAAMGDGIVIDGPMPSFGFGCLNYGHHEPWTDDRVRRAITMSIDQEEAAIVYQQGEGYTGGYFQPGGIWSITEDQLRQVPGYEPEGDAKIAEARKLLDAAGVPDGYETRMLTRKLSSYERLSLFLQDRLARIGVHAEIDIQETAAAYDALNQRAFDLAPWGHGYALDDPDALFAEFFVTGAPRNYSGVGSQEVDDLFLQQSSELDPEARLELVHQMEMAALALYGESIVSWNSATEVRYPHVIDRVKHPSTYNNQRWERVWLDL